MKSDFQLTKDHGKIYQQDGAGVVRTDPYLEPFRDALVQRYFCDRVDLIRSLNYFKYKNNRYAHFKYWLKKIEDAEPGGLDAFTRGHQRFGFTYDAQRRAIVYREWAPNATQAFLIGDFSAFQFLL